MSGAVTGPARLFEAFFWIDPVREGKTKVYENDAHIYKKSTK
jgi:hypothetical protein